MQKIEDELEDLFESQYSGLQFKVEYKTTEVEVTITDNGCSLSDPYCLVPKKSTETGITDPITGNELPYRYLRLKFKTLLPIVIS